MTTIKNFHTQCKPAKCGESGAFYLNGEWFIIIDIQNFVNEYIVGELEEIEGELEEIEELREDLENAEDTIAIYNDHFAKFKNSLTDFFIEKEVFEPTHDEMLDFVEDLVTDMEECAEDLYNL